MNWDIVTNLSYLIASALFIFGLKLLSSPKTARRGNALAATGMLLAVVVTLLDQQILSFGTILMGFVIGSIVGAAVAHWVKMTAMPQMVAVFNGFGGGASALIAWVEFSRLLAGPAELPAFIALAVVLSLLIGAVTLSGSLVAFGKLQEWVSTAPVRYPLQHPLNLLIFLGLLAFSAYLVGGAAELEILLAITGISLLLGVLLVLPIGGADMPIVVSLLNSYSGLAGAAAGFVIGSNILIIAGALVGASGIILTSIMCRAMNRSLVNVVFGGFGTGSGNSTDTGSAGGTIREATVDEAAIILGYARSVIFVPGYGLAVSQAQHQLRELADLLEQRGAKIRYAIHPVAGRMPGHMNVLLAEANVSYDKLNDLEEINPEFSRTEVAVVVGSNDVVNPSARDVPDSPIYGMPILNVDEADHVLVLKRSLKPGFSGADNPLFYKDKTMLLFGDAQDSLKNLAQEVKAL
ncbi:NAD(P)(+) transhydrogenase (Re/Si-specific) subunit beta [Desmospora profundinema]|uniref:NAD(P) transhydrogenase subunit beta n=1 Tax=Desmospora profundinema TaxID=1571184 RepID=A0ABU1IQG3_9BACL|nr:NAD(P)(+) transhydrogenase (Re/Si-specific) subunit beta [Desmospora profundinema]MDR6226777.1 NAD(P) transhydrogenase subunit beta [Desmospora profundinema]